MSLMGSPWTAVCQAQADSDCAQLSSTKQRCVTEAFPAAKGMLPEALSHPTYALSLAASQMAPRWNVPYPQALPSSRLTASAELPTLATAAASSSWLHPSAVVQ